MLTWINSDFAGLAYLGEHSKHGLSYRDAVQSVTDTPPSGTGFYFRRAEVKILPGN